MAWSLYWASVNIVVVLFLLATFSSPPTLPPRLWGESTEPQNIARVRQNKAPMCARYNNLQCLPCHPKLLEHTVFQPCLPTFLHAGEPCSLLLSSTGAGSVSAPSCPSVPAPRSSSPWGSRAGAAYPDHLQGPSGISRLLRNVWGLLEISHCQQVSQADQAPQYLPSAVARTRLFTGC